ncbi:hypothetical protein Pan265_06180 [Mucisphaera calidilacus]|uniref:Haemolysin activator HlyB C-terminal domain-containing protein n=2 Tax=Mucisphaera calidilacus TaxID=2527982 RepID=A0A518BUZ3_9BACT|nr:hypothetical protein Pan265_06180 [Mucisphaera calidilacus]
MRLPEGQAVVASELDGPAFPVGRLRLKYAETHPQQPGLEVLMSSEVRLTPTPTGYVAEREGAPVEVLALSSIGHDGTRLFHASAIQMISRSIAAGLNERGLVGVFVAPDPIEIDVYGVDQRVEGDDGLTMVVSTSVVNTTITRVSDQDGESVRENDAVDAWIPAGAPVRPWTGQGPREDLLWLDRLEDYTFRLNRQPGRRVDVAVTAIDDEEGEPGVELEYLITQAKPWRVFAQVSNTGTEQTNEWRESLGFMHNQLSGNDDRLVVSYSTAGFEDSHAFTASYDAPFERGGPWRYRAIALYSEYDASEVGIQNAAFTGSTASISGEISRQVYQHRDVFIDMYVGLSLSQEEADNQAAGTDIEEIFLIPEIGVRGEVRRQTESVFGQLSLAGNLPGVNNDELDNFGRDDIDGSWVVMRGIGSASYYLEPLFDREAWQDPTTPETSTLAHEVQFRVEGQKAFGSRLLPSQQMTVGGFATVRGYKESTTSGDDAIVGSVEYRFHAPRLLPVVAEPAQLPLLAQPFRVAPPQVYAYPDWDLVFKTFLDAGATWNSDIQAGETNEILLSTGIGFEVSVKQTLQVRVDWGVGLRDLDDGSRDAGDSRLHVEAGIVY